MQPAYDGGAATFRSHVVGVSANRSQLPSLMYIKPSDPDNSFLLYKITGQQDKIPVGGAQMPDVSPPMPLSTQDQCTLINWVRTGAT
jgi:hypothetical protein